MKYVKQIGLIVAVSASCMLAGCGTQQSKSADTQAEPGPVLASTLEHIPSLEKDKEGNIKPYLPAENPYAALKGKIKKESIVAFIDGKRLYTAGKYDKAEAAFKKITELDKKLSGPWVYLGDIAAEKKQPELEKAEESYKKAIEVNPKNVNAYLRLALTQRKLGKFLLAQNTYAAALNVWKDFPEAHLNLAILYDVYLNHPIRAQRHMEAYQFLTQGQSTEVAEWLQDIQKRTGMTTQLKVMPVFAVDG